jgi:CDGSH-type Zn-finger protein
VPSNPAKTPRRVTVIKGGPVLIEGPVEVIHPDGTTTLSHRFTVAICTCGRTQTHPWCDTSHRTKNADKEQGKGDDTQEKTEGPQ